MCTDRTLNEHIKKYHELSAKIKELEEAKKSEQIYIIGELDSRNIDKFGTVKIMSRTEEKPDKDKLKMLYPTIYEEVKKITVSSRFLRACKA